MRERSRIAIRKRCKRTQPCEDPVSGGSCSRCSEDGVGGVTGTAFEIVVTEMSFCRHVSDRPPARWQSGVTARSRPPRRSRPHHSTRLADKVIEFGMMFAAAHEVRTGRAVQSECGKWKGLVLRICIRPLNGAFVLLAVTDIRAHPISF